MAEESRKCGRKIIVAKSGKFLECAENFVERVVWGSIPQIIISNLAVVVIFYLIIDPCKSPKSQSIFFFSRSAQQKPKEKTNRFPYLFYFLSSDLNFHYCNDRYIFCDRHFNCVFKNNWKKL